MNVAVNTIIICAASFLIGVYVHRWWKGRSR